MFDWSSLTPDQVTQWERFTAAQPGAAQAPQGGQFSAGGLPNIGPNTAPPPQTVAPRAAQRAPGGPPLSGWQSGGDAQRFQNKDTSAWANKSLDQQLQGARDGTWQSNGLSDFFNSQFDTNLSDSMRQQIGQAAAFRRDTPYSDPTASQYIPPTNGMGPGGGPALGGQTIDRSYTGPAGGNVPAPGGVQAGGPGGYNPGGGGAQWNGQVAGPGQGQNIAGSVQGGALGGTFGQAAPGQAPPTGLIGSEMAQQQGLSGALGGIQGGLNNYNQQANRASSLLGGFATNGQGANGVMAAQSGALGGQAQQDAYNNFNDSPGQQFLRDRGEQAIVRNAAATGGLGGGNVQKALATFGQGLAQQDFGNQFNRLGQVSNQGFAATQGQSNLAQGQGQAGLNSGFNAAQYNFNTGQNMGSGRTLAGQQIADSVANTTSGLADLINQQGQGLSNIVGAGGINQAMLLAGLGQQTGYSQENLAAGLGNISIGQGSAIARQPHLGGLVQSGGASQGVADVSGGIGALLAGLGYANQSQFGDAATVNTGQQYGAYA